MVLLVAVTMLGVSSQASAVVVQFRESAFPGVAYTGADNGRIGENTGVGNQLIVMGGSAGNNVSLLRFDNLDLPAGATINSATLTLGLIELGFDGTTSLDVSVYGLLVPYKQSEASWANRQAGQAWNGPGATATSGSYTFDGAFDRLGVADDTVTFTPSSPTGVVNYEWDVTTSFVAQYNAGNLYGFAGVASSNFPASSATFASFVPDFSGHPFRPMLTVDYTPIPEPSSMLLIGLGGLAALRRRRASAFSRRIPTAQSDLS